VIRLPRFLATFVGEWRGQYRDMKDVHARDALNERRWDPVRTRRARLALSATGALLILTVTPAFVVSSVAGATVTVGLVALWMVLRRSLREIGDLPDRVLDERQVALRNRAYRIAWKVFMGGFTLVLPLTAGLLYAASDRGASLVEITLPLEAGLGAIVALGGIVALLPYVVLAWLEPEEERHEPALRIVRQSD
jgi:hypothetical protein